MSDFNPAIDGRSNPFRLPAIGNKKTAPYTETAVKNLKIAFFDIPYAGIIRVRFSWSRRIVSSQPFSQLPYAPIQFACIVTKNGACVK